MTAFLEGKVAIVTGAGRGIGRAHALALAAAGARVVVNDLGGTDRGEGADSSVAQSVVDEIRASGGEAVTNTDSVADWQGARQIVQCAVDEFGDIDILVNNAGISRFAEIDVLTQADWDLTLAVNLTGTAATMHWASAFWRESGVVRPRAVVNTSSPAGTNPIPMSTAYVASKAAVSAITAATSEPMARLGARINAIAPIARTRLTDAVPFMLDIMNRKEGDFDPGDPANIAPIVVYLASPMCRFTGRTFGIDGSDLYLFNGYSAEHHFQNGAKTWTAEGLAHALEEIDPFDHGFAIAPAARFPGPHPSLEAMDLLSRGLFDSP